MGNIIDFNEVRRAQKAVEYAQLDDLQDKIDGMDMDAAIRHLLRIEENPEAATQFADAMEAFWASPVSRRITAD